MPVTKIGLILAISGLLTACAATQARINTLQMVNDVSRIREAQVIRNLSAAISDHDFVPAEIFLGAGQASVSLGTSQSVTLPKFDFSQNGRALGLGASDSWSALWQVAPVTNADDLRSLRNLYVLVVSTDEDYERLEGYLERHPSMHASCAGRHPTREVLGERVESAPDWCEAKAIISTGDSIGCKLYQEGAGPKQRGVPFRRWLYWRASGDPQWRPEAPELAPQTLGHVGPWEIATTSRACFNDFVILVQAQTKAAAAAAVVGPKANP